MLFDGSCRSWIGPPKKHCWQIANVRKKVKSGLSQRFQIFGRFRCWFRAYSLCGLLLVDRFSHLESLLQSMKLYYNVRNVLEKSANGTQMGPATASNQIGNFEDVFTTPEIGFSILDEMSTRYVHLLFGIRYKDLRRIETVFVTLIYSAFIDLEKYWRDLVKDVRLGTLKEDLNIPVHIREGLLPYLTPSPERAGELEAEFCKGDRIFFLLSRIFLMPTFWQVSKILLKEYGQTWKWWNVLLLARFRILRTSFGRGIPQVDSLNSFLWT